MTGRGWGPMVWAVMAVAVVSLVAPDVAWASAGGGAEMPWNTPLQALTDNLSGTTARIVGILAFCIAGLLWMYTRAEQGAARFAGALFGCACAIGAANIVDALAFSGATIG